MPPAISLICVEAIKGLPRDKFVIQSKIIHRTADEAREAEREDPGPSALERAQEAADARRALEQLAERDRNALLMREEGLDYQEIADALELSVGSVGTTLARARRRLAEAYETMQAERTRRSGHAAS